MDSRPDFIEIDGLCYVSLKNYYLTSEFSKNGFSFHNELEISLIKSGSGIYTVEEKEYDIQKGDIFIFNNIESHYISYIDPASNLVNMVLMFDPRFVWSMESNLFDSRFLDVFFKRNEFFENRLDRNKEFISDIRKLLLEIEDEFIRKPPEYQLMVKVKLLNILVLLIRHSGYVSSDKNAHPRRINDLVLINKVISFINNNLSYDIQLKDMADIAHMNPSYFSSFFKKYMGSTPWEYLSRQRICRAIEYLNSSNMTILDIAVRCGFNSTASFNKAFKRLTGKTPSDFR